MRGKRSLGNVKNMQNCDIAATCEKREFLFVTKLRNPFATPMSRYCGPFTGPIGGHWNPCWKPIMKLQ